jgi:endonuclease YncB( thermonuclease family)
MRAALFLLAVLVAPSGAWADFTGRVVKVQDGDTLTVLVNRQQIRVRLESIDAPELRQPFGKRSRQSLADMCAGKDAHVNDRGKDRYGRTLGGVTCAGVDANSEQVRRGMAWVFARYVPVGSPLYEFEAYARLRQIGLWADPQAVAPWDWRAAKRRSETGR